MVCEWLSASPGFPGSSVVKNLPANAGDAGVIPGSGRDPGEGNNNPLQYSCLGNSMDRGAWLVTIHGVSKELGTTWRLKQYFGVITGMTPVALKVSQTKCNKTLRDHHMGKGHRIWGAGKAQQGKGLENHQPTVNKKAHANHKQKCQFTLSGSVFMPWKRKPTHTSRVGRDASWPRWWHS